MSGNKGLDDSQIPKSIRSKGESSFVNEYEKTEKKVEEESKEAKGETKNKSDKEE